MCGCVTEVGCLWGGTRVYITSDVRPSYFNLLNLELCEECSGTLSARAYAWRGAAVQADAIGGGGGGGGGGLPDAIGEQQLKRTQSGSSAAADASSEQQLKRRRGAAVEADRAAVSRGAAAEADAIGEQQLCTKSCPAPNYSRRRTRGNRK